ncbi:MAG TPA: hypothetical protein VG778_05190 [Blastocatellia bacterium]|nr:hypothetical protein [Blastocatellia bacterium]
MNRLSILAVLCSMVVAVTGCQIVGSTAGSGGSGEDKVARQFTMVIAANETAAKARLLAISTAEAVYQAESGGEFATLEELEEAEYMGDPSEGKLANYRFEVRVKPGGFEATAVPEKYGVTGNNSFYIDETRVMRGADKKGAKATSSDPPMQ